MAGEVVGPVLEGGVHGFADEAAKLFAGAVEGDALGTGGLGGVLLAEEMGLELLPGGGGGLLAQAGEGEGEAAAEPGVVMEAGGGVVVGGLGHVLVVQGKGGLGAATALAGAAAPAVDEDAAEADGEEADLGGGGLAGKEGEDAPADEAEEEILHGILGGLGIAAALAGDVVEVLPVGAAEVIAEGGVFSRPGQGWVGVGGHRESR